MPSTARKLAPLAARIRSGVSKTSSNFRNRTGPIFGSMFSAMQASVVVHAIFKNRRIKCVGRDRWQR